ncbi:hypothetical protein SteCoe_1736 [Stentor coeruleus]|uniref:RING-type domain-containing protein n=1 Tax=Stentor coeruleus TaxID=5963 RepID=A0A1R2D1B8_9CILI|nr:hypothetical protein SteCoe_1736 [Stentor coeruleus]
MIIFFLCLYQAFSSKIPISIYEKSLKAINIPQSNKFTIISSNSSSCDSCFFLGSRTEIPNLSFNQNQIIWESFGEFSSIESFANKKLELIIPPQTTTINIKISVFSFSNQIGAIELIINYTESGCPIECQEHGECLNDNLGMKYCQCYEGYFGYGCSVLVKDIKIGKSVSENVSDFGIAFFNIKLGDNSQVINYGPVNETYFFNNANPKFLPSFLDCQDNCDESKFTNCTTDICHIGIFCPNISMCSITVSNTEITTKSILLVAIISTFTIMLGLGIPFLIFLCCRRYRVARNEIPKQLSAKEFENLCPETNWSNDNKSETCSICLEDFNTSHKVRKLKCNHVFHTKCIDEWALSHPTCPICKDVIKSS